MTKEDIDSYVSKNPTIVSLNSWIEPYVEASINSPLVSIASHGFLDDQLQGHPRTSGTYSKVLGHYVRELGSLTLMEALKKMTLMPARRLEQRVPAMRRKGRIQIGADADLVLFDPNVVLHKATYQEPTIPPEGIEYVIVNGVIVVENGEQHEGLFPGLPIRAPVESSGNGK